MLNIYLCRPRWWGLCPSCSSRAHTDRKWSSLFWWSCEEDTCCMSWSAERICRTQACTLQITHTHARTQSGNDYIMNATDQCLCTDYLDLMRNIGGWSQTFMCFIKKEQVLISIGLWWLKCRALINTPCCVPHHQHFQRKWNLWCIYNFTPFLTCVCVINILLRIQSSTEGVSL